MTRVRRGFTLVELMVVVAIVGILAVLGIMGFRRHVANAYRAEGLHVVQSVRAAQERWRSETGAYLDVSSDMASLQPAAPDGSFRNLLSTGSDSDYWRLLNPVVKAPVLGGYATRAAGPLVDPDQGGYSIGFSRAVEWIPGSDVPQEPWFVVVGVMPDARFGASSFNQTVEWEDE